MEAAVSGGLGGLEIVLLGRLDIAASRAAAHHGANDGREAGRRQIGDALRLEGDAAGGRRGHAPRAAGAGTVQHVDRSDFTLALDESSADFRQSAGEIFWNFILRRDGVTGKEAAARPYGGFGDGLAALHKFSCHSFYTPPFLLSVLTIPL
ncbi:hypothetical protein SDC9_181745 [bioreactor metagenome]|uniref:Uncharacterized protein n=1 Tax=bioreactor metagenome TaxID=1076179 RepID=A0A645H7B4_9ZZZZ